MITIFKKISPPKISESRYLKLRTPQKRITVQINLLKIGAGSRALLEKMLEVVGVGKF